MKSFSIGQTRLGLEISGFEFDCKTSAKNILLLCDAGGANSYRHFIFKHRLMEFAKQTGIGNFEAYYKPLSKDDTLGHALLVMRDGLSENERVLEQKVIERTEQQIFGDDKL